MEEDSGPVLSLREIEVGATPWGSGLPAHPAFRSLLVFGDVLPAPTRCYREGDSTESIVLARMGAMSKTGTLRILYGEGEEEAQAAPAAAFEKAGHSVQKALGRKAAVEALQKGAFDLVVLGPSLTRNDRHHLPYMAKKVQPAAAVLVMHADGSRHPYVDACTDTGASVENVLARIEGMQIAGVMTAGAAAGKS